MVAATQTTRFLPFLDPAEESAVLATAPIKSFDRGQLVLDQNVMLRAIFLIEEGSVRVERKDRDQTIPLALPGWMPPASSSARCRSSTARLTEVPGSSPTRLTRLRVIDEATINNLIKKDPAVSQAGCTRLDCGHPFRAVAYLTSMHLGTRPLIEGITDLLQPDLARRSRPPPPKLPGSGLARSDLVAAGEMVDRERR